MSKLSDMPLPNDPFFDGTVIASKWMNDEEDYQQIFLLVMFKTPPYYGWLEIFNGKITILGYYYNIADAVKKSEWSED